MRYGISIIVGMLLCVLTGCARLPETPGGGVAPTRTIRSTITVLGEINPNYYYFLAIDTDGNSADGPVPIVTGSESGNGWGTISNLGPNDTVIGPPFYVMYHDGTFAMFRQIPGANQYQFLGQPFFGEVSTDRKTMTVEVDQSALVPTGTALPDTIQLNWITDEMIVTPPQLIGAPKQYDAIGPQGNQYLFDIQLGVNQTIQAGVGTAPEELQRDSTSLDDIDMTEYTVQIRVQAP